MTASPCSYARYLSAKACRLQTSCREFADNNPVKSMTWQFRLSAVCNSCKHPCRLDDLSIISTRYTNLVSCTRKPTSIRGRGWTPSSSTGVPLLAGNGWPNMASQIPPQPHQQKKEVIMTKPLVVKTIDFSVSPDEGTILIHDGQRYRVAGIKPHVRKGGTRTTLIIWQSHCAECGQPFEFTTPLKTRYPSRRCKQHSKPGRAVSYTGRRLQSNARKRFRYQQRSNRPSPTTKRTAASIAKH